MDNTSDFKFLVDTFLRCSFSIKDGYAEITLDTDAQSEKMRLIAALTQSGFLGALDEDHGKIGIPLQAKYWRVDSSVFSSIDDFWQKIKSMGHIPESYFILKERISSVDSSKSKQVLSIDSYIQWKWILAFLSNHEVRNDYIFFVPNDDGGRELVINAACRLNSLLECDMKEDSLTNALEIIKVLSINDAQSPERIFIMKAALLDVFDKIEEKSILKLICFHERFFKKYNELLDLYTKRFSINKILNELDQKNIEYTTKINEFISSSQNKAFTIPGALIAVGGLAKASGLLNSLLIIIGLLMVYYITSTANSVHNESYDSLKRSLVDSFSRYSQFDEGAEVKEAANKISQDLYYKIDKAKDRLKSIDDMAKGMIIIGAIYLMLRILTSAN
ncbi:hypothetical protein QK118_004199 [Yersinia enterocolitica]|nr:hypothetical protein [Yersinia enterocolitica]ELW8207429.1 hypothetical protein [Yersinia enterocolitica]